MYLLRIFIFVICVVLKSSDLNEITYEKIMHSFRHNKSLGTRENLIFEYKKINFLRRSMYVINFNSRCVGACY